MNLQFEHKLDNLWNSNILQTNSGVIVTTNWTSDRVPSAIDDLLIPAGMDVLQEGQAQHANTDDVAHTLTVANGASLISKSKLTIGGDFINSGTTTIFRGNRGFTVAGTIQNDGTLNIVNQSTAATGLDLASGFTRLFGGGQVILAQIDGGYGGYIDALTAGSTLQNDSTILGIGTIGSRGPYAGGTDMTLINGAAGVIDGRSTDVNSVLLISSSTPVINHGTLRGSGAGGLSLANLTVQNNDGFLDGNGGRVLLYNTTIQGGTLQSSGAGAIVAQGDGRNVAPNNILDGSTGSGAVRNNGVLTGAGIGLKGSIANGGTIRGGDSTAPGALLFLLDDANKSGVTLTGGGFVDLYSAGTGNSVIIGNSTTVVTTLHNVDNTIRGAGTIGTSGVGDRGNDSDPSFRLQFDNKAGGTVNATPTGGSPYGLTLGLSDGITNAGLLEATIGGKLLITKTTVTNIGAGTITAIGTGSHVDIYDSVIQGGTIASSGGGIVNVVANQTETLLDNTTAQGSIKLTGTLAVTRNATLRLKGTLTDTGTLIDASAGRIVVDTAGVTLAGSGALFFSGGSLIGSTTTAVSTLRNTATIAGGGFIGAGFYLSGNRGDNLLRVENRAGAVINANDATTALTVQSITGLVNTGLVEATASGGLDLRTTTLDQTGGGTTTAIGTGSHVDLTDVTILGGTLSGSAGGVVTLNTQSAGTILDGSTAAGAVSLSGAINLGRSSSTLLKGTIANAGTILLGTDGQEVLSIGGSVTLSGGGTVRLAVPTSGSNAVQNATSTRSTLTTDNAIIGTGLIGQAGAVSDDVFQLVTSGLINANIAGATLKLRTGIVPNVGPTTTTTSTIEATGGGILAIADTSVLARGATLYAATGSAVTLNNSVVYGGTLVSDGTGAIEALGFTAPSTINGASVGGAVTILGNLKIDNAATLALVGNITNNGRILLQGSDRQTVLTAGAVLTGSGTIQLADSSNNFIDGSLTNGTNTISGAGTISATLTNLGGGTIAAIYADQALNLTGANLANDGVLKADGGRLVVTGTVTGSGSFAVAHGGTLDIQGTSSEAIAFQDRTGTVRLTKATTAAITGFSAGDKIDLAFLNPNGLTTSYAANTGILTLQPASGAAVTLKVQGFDDTSFFRLASDNGTGVNGNNGTLLTLAADPTPRLTLNFAVNQASYGHDAAGGIVITGADGAHALPNGVTLVRFTDGLVNATPSGPGGLIDPLYYYIHNPDVFAAGVDAATHYSAYGYKEGRSPSDVFDVRYYLRTYPDIAAAGIDPLKHFHDVGWKEGRNPSASFSVRDYLAAYPDIKAAGIDPLAHYLAAGRAEHRVAFPVSAVAPDPLVDAAYYYAHNPDVLAAGADATEHFFAAGGSEGRNPSALFDSHFYLTQNPDIAAAGINPLRHFETYGYAEGRQPSLLFDDARYLAAYPDVKAAGLDPLLHYITAGQAEGRSAFLLGGIAATDPLIDAAFFDRQLGATLLPTGLAASQQAAYLYDNGGWQKGLNPDALFDTKYYLAHNTDVANAHIDPLLHYEAFGWHEGRDPSAAFSVTKYLAAYSDVRNANIDPLYHYITSGQSEGRSAFAV